MSKTKKGQTRRPRDQLLYQQISTGEAIQEKPGTLRNTSYDVTHSFAAASLTEFPGIPPYFRTGKRQQSSKGIPENIWDQFLTQDLRRANFP